MKILIFILLFVGLVSCNNRTSEINKDNLNGMVFPEFQESNSGLVNFLQNKDTLFITVQFSDCGEWGGHKESIKLYKNIDGILKGQLKIDSVSCENIRSYGDYSAIDDKSRKVVKVVNKKLNPENEKLINLFIHRILELKLNFELSVGREEEIIPIFKDSGTHIEIRNSKSTFYLDYYNIDRMANTWFGKVRKELFEL